MPMSEIPEYLNSAAVGDDGSAISYNSTSVRCRTASVDASITCRPVPMSKVRAETNRLAVIPATAPRETPPQLGALRVSTQGPESSAALASNAITSLRVAANTRTRSSTATALTLWKWSYIP